jgi:putative membrane protein insertion efficiency factor
VTGGWVRRALWVAGAPARLVLIGLIRVYRLTAGQMVGGGCRFYPSCSAYAEAAIRNTGAVRGSILAAWRVLRCSPLSKGGVDHPPSSHLRESDGDTQPAVVGGAYESIILTGPTITDRGAA